MKSTISRHIYDNHELHILLTLNIVTVSETTELLLTGGIPNVESNLSSICVKHERVNFNTQSS